MKLMTIPEIAPVLGISASNLKVKKDKYPGFPDPIKGIKNSSSYGLRFYQKANFYDFDKVSLWFNNINTERGIS